MNSIEKVRDLLRQAEVGKALKFMLGEGTQFPSKVVDQFMTRYNLTEKDWSGKVISRKDYRLELNQIASDIKNLLSELEETGEQILQSQSEVGETGLEDTFRVIENLKNNLWNNPGKDTTDEYRTAVEKVVNELMMDYQQLTGDFLPVKEQLSFVLFDKILTSPQLDTVAISDVERYQAGGETFAWHEKALIISALTLSLLNFAQLNGEKLRLLIEFVFNDNPQVWKRALVGLTLVLKRHKRKVWHRANGSIKKKLQALQALPEVQIGFQMIFLILETKGYEGAFIPGEIYQHPFFKDNMANCFLPFYEGNPVLEDGLKDADPELDGEEYGKMLHAVPIVAPLKYYFSLHIPQVKKEDVNKGDTDALILHLPTGNWQVFFNEIAKYYGFFSHFSHENFVDHFQKETFKSRTTLEEFILSRKSRLIVEGNFFLAEEKPKKARKKFEELRKMDPEDKGILSRLKECYDLEKDYPKSLELLLEVKENGMDDFATDEKIARTYENMHYYKTATPHFENALEESPENLDLASSLIRCYLFDDYLEKAEELLDRFREKGEDDIEFQSQLCTFYDKKKNFAEGERIAKRCLEIGSPNRAYKVLIGHYYRAKNWEKSMEYFELVHEETSSKKSSWNRYITGGILNLELKEYEVALRMMEQSVSYLPYYHPGLDLVHNIKGFLLILNRKLTQGKSFLNKNISRFSDLHKALASLRLGYIEYILGNEEEARKLFTGFIQELGEGWDKGHFEDDLTHVETLGIDTKELVSWIESEVLPSIDFESEVDESEKGNRFDDITDAISI